MSRHGTKTEGKGNRLLGLGAVVIFVLLVLSVRGGGAWSLFDAHAFLIVFGGTVAAAALAFPTSVVFRLPRLFFMAITQDSLRADVMAAQLVKASQRVQSQGRLAAVGNARDLDDAFLRTGLGMVADGFEPREIQALLETELDAMRARHRLGIGLYESMGGFSPVFGILGTVEAMIAILGNLSNPDKLGPEIALAMVATLYGVAFANLLFLPVASRLKKLSEDELRIRQMTIDILVNIQEGAKFEFIRERMRLSLPPATRRTIAALSERKRNRARRAEVEAPQPVAAPEEPMDAYPHDENHGQDGYDDDEMY